MYEISRVITRYKRVVRFLVAGGVATGAQLVTLYIFTDVFGFWYVGSATLAFIVAVIISFSSHKWWTFRDFHRGAINRQFVFYLILQIANLGLNVALIYLLVDVIGVWYLLSQAIISTLLAITSFFIYKHIVFVYGEYHIGGTDEDLERSVKGQ